jgi:hypothetical protein
MKRIPKQEYTAQFKEQAVGMDVSEGFANIRRGPNESGSNEFELDASASPLGCVH